MDETSPVYENFLNNMSKFSGGTTRRVAASKFLQREDKPTVEGNARKISLIAGILRTRRINTGKMVSSLSRGSVKGAEESIMDIRETMTSILETLKAQQKFEYERFLDMQRREENKRRGAREGLLERVNKSGMRVIKRGVDKVITPVRNMFSTIIGFFTKLFLGRIMMKFLNFFSDPRNIGIVEGISNFIGTFFPVIVGGVVAATVGIAALGVRMFGLANVLRAAAISLGLVSPLSALGGVGISRGAGKGMKMPTMSKIGGDALMRRIPRFPTFSMPEKMPSFKLLLPPMGKAGRGLFNFNRGGVVPGSGNTDTVPAMLTPGEVVISKPAVNMFGLGNLLGMNRAAGSTSRPSMRGGISYANEGMVTPNIGDLFNSLINTANQLPESPLGKKMIEFETPMKQFAERVGSQVSTDDVKGLAGSLQTNVPRILGSKMNIPKITSAVRDLPNLLPINVNNEGGGSIFDDLSGIMNKFNNPDLSDASAENDLFDVELTSPSLEKLHTLGMFA